ncbi:hypothetical protein EMCRGX_G034515 [Ephydatia muelleri]
MVKKRSEPAQRPPSEKGSPLDAKKGQREGRGACSVIPVERRFTPSQCCEWTVGRRDPAQYWLLKTMVHSHSVRKKELLKKSTVVHCAHGDFTEYPMAKVCIEVDGQQFTTVAAVSNNLLVDVLLGTDIPTLGTLIPGGWWLSQQAVTTRSKVRREASTKEADHKKQQESRVRPTSLSEVTGSLKEVWSALDNTALEGGKRGKPYLTRRQRREGRKNNTKEAALFHLRGYGLSDDGLRVLIGMDPTMDVVRRAADKGESDGRVNFVWKKGLLYRVVAPTKEVGVGGREQLVLPKECRVKVMELAHSIPMARPLEQA